MKKIGIIAMALMFISTALVAQEKEREIITKSDTATFKLKNKIITIVNREPDEVIIQTTDSIVITERSQRHNHFAGIDFGVNGFLSENNDFDLQQGAEFMDLDYTKSWSIAFNFFEIYVPLAQEKFGVSTGLGLEFNNYHFDREITLGSNESATFGIFDATKNIDKNRLKATILNWPVFLETNIGKDADHSFHLALGGMLSYRVGSKTKQEFELNGEDFKVKNRTDFNMNPFRFSAVARVGYGDFTIFASYSLTSFFDDDKGPEIHPITAGVSVVTW